MERGSIAVDLRYIKADKVLELYQVLKELGEEIFFRVEEDFKLGVPRRNPADLFLYYEDEWCRGSGYVTNQRKILTPDEFVDFLYSL